MPIPPTRQTMPLMPAELQGLMSQDEEQETIPLPSADLLRTMFAELGGKTGAPPVVPAGQMAADPVQLGVTPDPNVVESLAPRPDTVDTVDAADTPERVYDAAPAPSVVDEAGAVDAEPLNGFTAADEQEMRQSQQLPETLEALERQFSASGFTPIETRPGLLAEIERTQQSGGSVVLPPPSSPSPPSEQPKSDDPASATPSTPADPVAPERDDPPLSVKSGPDPHDYPARLTHARKRRDDGQLDDALNEYRAIIKNAPDLLPEVLSDLRASLAETPDHPNLHSVLGDALVCQGDYEQALESYNKAMELAQARSERA
jgi:tetratricopeptide repeat protein